MPTRLALLVLVALAYVTHGCTEKNMSSAGECDESTVCPASDEKTFCDIDGVYIRSNLPNECIAPPSADACNRAEPCPSSGRPFCTDNSMGVCVECRGDEDCGSGEVCDGSNECIIFTCTQGSIGDAACATMNALQSYCGADSLCVGCLNSNHCPTAESGVCDEADSQCRACETNQDCDSKVCRPDTGICAAAENIVYVDKTGTDGATCGTVASPCLTIDGPQGGTLKLTATRNKIVIGEGNYVEAVDISSGVVTLVADGAVTLQPTTGPGLAVSGSANVTAQGLKILHENGPNNGDAVTCEDAGTKLVLEDMDIRKARGVGVVSNNCETTITDSTIFLSAGLGVHATDSVLTVSGSTISRNSGGLRIATSDYRIENNIIANNSNDFVGGMQIVSDLESETKVVRFNTFAENSRVDPGFAIGCSSSNLVASNNVYLHRISGLNTAFVSGSSCRATYSLFDTDVALPAGIGNIAGDAVFLNPGSDYHLMPGSPGIDAADPAATLGADIDGDMRPLGGRHDMGADEVE